MRNAIHGSGSGSEFQRESSFFFSRAFGPTAAFNNCTNTIDTVVIQVNANPSFTEFINPTSGLNCQFDPIEIGVNYTNPGQISWNGPGIIGPNNSVHMVSY